MAVLNLLACLELNKKSADVSLKLNLQPSWASLVRSQPLLGSSRNDPPYRCVGTWEKGVFTLVPITNRSRAPCTGIKCERSNSHAILLPRSKNARHLLPSRFLHAIFPPQIVRDELLDESKESSGYLAWFSKNWRHFLFSLGQRIAVSKRHATWQPTSFPGCLFFERTFWGRAILRNLSAWQRGKVISTLTSQT